MKIFVQAVIFGILFLAIALLWKARCNSVKKGEASAALSQVDALIKDGIVQKRIAESLHKFNPTWSEDVLIHQFKKRFQHSIVSGLINSSNVFRRDPISAIKFPADAGEELDLMSKEGFRLAYEIGTLSKWNPDVLGCLGWIKISDIKLHWDPPFDNSRPPPVGDIRNAFLVDLSNVRVDPTSLSQTGGEIFNDCRVTGWLEPLSPMDDGPPVLLVTGQTRE